MAGGLEIFFWTKKFIRLQTAINLRTICNYRKISSTESYICIWMENSSDGRGECRPTRLFVTILYRRWCNLWQENFWLAEKFFSPEANEDDPWTDMKRKLNLLLRRPWNPVRGFRGQIELRLCFWQKKAKQTVTKQFWRKKKRKN